MKRRWRDYRTELGRSPVKDFIKRLNDVDTAAIAAAMKDVREHGLAAARHLRGDIYEVRADADNQTFRVLFAEEAKHGQVLLALEGYKKKTRKTPTRLIDLAEKRLQDWRNRGTS